MPNEVLDIIYQVAYEKSNIFFPTDSTSLSWEEQKDRMKLVVFIIRRQIKKLLNRKPPVARKVNRDPSSLLGLLVKYDIHSLRQFDGLLLEGPSSAPVCMGDGSFVMAAPKIWDSLLFHMSNCMTWSSIQRRVHKYCLQRNYFFDEKVVQVRELIEESKKYINAKSE